LGTGETEVDWRGAGGRPEAGLDRVTRLIRGERQRFFAVTSGFLFIVIVSTNAERIRNSPGSGVRVYRLAAVPEEC
jgi:hypothetical protein